MSRGRRRPSHRTRNTVLSVLAAGLLAGAGVTGYAKWRSGDAQDTALTVRYRTGVPASSGVAQPWLEVINSSAQPVNLGDVTLRYWYSADDGAPYAANCVQTSLGCSRITLTTAAAGAPAAQADHYLQVGFTSDAGTLAPGASTAAIGLQLYRTDGKKADQSDDRSFQAGVTHYETSERVSAYLRGTRVWGEEPEGNGPAPRTARAALPAGVLFDDFDYTGPHDPALAANGWEARDGEGGPGIKDSWSAQGVSFPAAAPDGTGTSGQTLRLTAESDGTRQGTRQSEFHTTAPAFSTGTLVARVRLSDKPVSGKDGDHVAQSFFTISPDHTSPKYSELDYEYMPNGGWDRYGPLMDTTSWRDSARNDRVTRSRMTKLGGWHTLVVTAVDGHTTYSVDGEKLFGNGSAHSPREPMTINFSTWFIDLPFKGPRTWDMQVDWLYYQAGKAVPAKDAQRTVRDLAAGGTHYVNTLPKS
ncbi:cellulose binding domain-containing protein [Streptomyces sp. Ru71]|uniref:cellulose binding domain-containing protein n=1 Tax=Streptomyces sp. Ru71 TaxID=2080746 RepID=UPI0021565118|nr:cellulose binding domain-containing protein [Streptomyces sp. Ru71]